MTSAIDAYLANKSEKDIGVEFSYRIKRNLLSSIKGKLESRQGLALKSTAKPIYKNGLLDRITLFTPYYVFPILDYGFEGTKINGINMRLKAGRFLADSLENGKVIKDLADIVGNRRANDIMFRTNFSFDSELETSNTVRK
ncbi:hypothetical protein ACNQF7_10090 [Flavobacterium sp. RSP29]|uniref:hypothetical protein n=1 Tax=Flavobacterium sp. RSP29 TaxID=3401731 RepID=UPI003AAF2286